MAAGPQHELLPWLAPVLRTSFFAHCRNHNSIGKHERNHFCLECHESAGALCPEGLGENHKNHLSLQIRKASHRDAVRVLDIQKLLDVSGIQAYTINSAKIVFLQSRTRPQKLLHSSSSSCKGGVRFNCETCHRSIADQVRFCSINCKRRAVGDSNLVAAQQDRPPSLELNFATCSSEDYSSQLNFLRPEHKLAIQGNFSSTELHAPNSITSFRDGRAHDQLQDKLLCPTTPSSCKNSKKQQQLYNSTTLVQQQPQFSNKRSSQYSTGVLLKEETMINPSSSCSRQIDKIPAENSPLRLMQLESASMHKRKKFCTTDHQPLQGSSNNFPSTSPMMSVLADHHHQPPRSSCENSWSKSDLSPRSFFGPSTPPSMEEANSRTHSRKQCHPHRAPLF